MKKKPYIIVNDWCVSALENLVIEKMKEGYEPIGSIIVDPIERQYIQPMVKREKSTKTKGRKK